MSTFILMTRLGPEHLKDSRQRMAEGARWLEKVKAACPDVKWVGHYALLGQYDFMDIYEAEDAETAARVSLISRAHGAETAETWEALPYDKYLGLLAEVAG
jgi:uncharacterized protein with GYD domain